ncbi:MAG: hypothetical protein K2X81_01430, partial [Candidatus Obscuribacterales bacterium]|nr:hypothetical protein [Candidatus Obscuribacterales bacterium]
MSGHDITHSIPLTIFLVAYIIWGIGAATALLTGDKVSNKIYSAFLFLGSIALLSGVVLAWPDNFSFVIAKPLEIVFCPLVNRIDALSSIFLALLGVCTSAIAVFSPGYLDHIKGRMRPGLYWFCIYAFVAAMSQVVLSANAITFLLFFEIMSVSAAALVASQHQKRQARYSSLIYLGASRVATAFLTAAFVWFFYLTNSWSFTDWRLDLHGMLMPSIFVFLGLAIKAGLFPFQNWMPYVYYEAPAPVAALMSGVKIKVVIYALIRLLIMSGPCNVYLAYTLLGLGIVSSLWGILFALVQSDLKRLLAYSSVENVGLIFSALGLTILAHANKLENIAAIALSAVLLHCVNHSIFKSLLFMNAGAIETSARTTDLAALGGLS